VPKVTTRSLYPECIANLKLPIDAFYRESRSGVNIAKRNITTGLFGLRVGLYVSFLPLADARVKTSWHKGLLVVKTIYTYGFHELFLKQT
jgi:hypothetical protein